MKKIQILLLSLASSIGAVAADIEVTPGQLESLWGDSGKGMTEMKLKGRIDARDLAALENLSSDVKTLDLSNVTIQALTMPNKKYFGRTLFAEGEIPAYTFFKSEVETLILPSGVSSILEGAFAGSAIKSITIPEGITDLSDYAFYGCPNLESVTLPASIKTIGKGAFGNCTSLRELDLSDTGITEVPERAFAGAVMLYDVILPDGVIKIGREAFSHTQIRELNLNKVKEFEAYALSGMPYLETLAISPSANIKDGLLMDNISLSYLTGLPEIVPDYFAANCSELPTYLASASSTLGKYSFANTLAPEELKLTDKITKIERGALSGLSNIRYINATDLTHFIPEVDEYSFEGLAQKDIELVVTPESYDAWMADPYWSLFNVNGTGTVSIVTLPAEESELKIDYSHGSLVIESSCAVNDVRIYTTEGRVVYISSPGERKVEIGSDVLPSGIIVVTASDEGGNTATSSFLLK